MQTSQHIAITAAQKNKVIFNLFYCFYTWPFPVAHYHFFPLQPEVEWRIAAAMSPSSCTFVIPFSLPGAAKKGWIQNICIRVLLHHTFLTRLLEHPYPCEKEGRQETVSGYFPYLLP